jgi:hypothetical protein
MSQADGDDDESSNSVSNFVGLIEGEDYGPGLVGPAGLYIAERSTKATTLEIAPMASMMDVIQCTAEVERS